MHVLIAAVLTAGATAETVAWYVPAVPDRLQVPAGETVTMSWGPPLGQLDIHDVWVMDDEDALDKCDFRRATELQVAIQRADVEVTGEAGQTRYFSCSIGEHCRDGQVLTVEWVNATAAPTPAPKKDDSDGATQRAVAVGLYISLAAAAALPFLG